MMPISCGAMNRKPARLSRRAIVQNGDGAPFFDVSR
jgi:hypothetical protein